MSRDAREEGGCDFSSEMPRIMSNLPDFPRRPFLYAHLCVYTKSMDRTVGDVLVRLVPELLHKVPVTIDTWLLDGVGKLPPIRSCVIMQVGVGEQSFKRITDHDHDPEVVRDMFAVHCNLQPIEMVSDSNERKLLAAVELILGYMNLLKDATFTLHFDNIMPLPFVKRGPRNSIHKIMLTILWIFVVKITSRARPYRYLGF